MWTVLLLAACKGPATPDDTDDTDVGTPATEVVPTPDFTGPVAELSADEATTLCASFDIDAFTLECDGYELAIGGTTADCPALLAEVSTDCDATVDDLLACAASIEAATCDTDFSEEPCRWLFRDECAPLGTLGEELLGAPFGLQDGIPLGALSDSQSFGLCLEFADYPSVSAVCDGSEITIEPTAAPECANDLALVPATCEATLGDARDCIEQVFAGDCDAIFGETDACARLLAPECVP